MIAGRTKANLTIIIKRIKKPIKPIIAAIATEMEPMMNMMAKALRKITKKRVKVDKTWTHSAK